MRDHALYLTVTIDTEEDNWGEYQRASYSVNNIGRIPRLQRVFANRGVRPTYLISHPVATTSSSIAVLGPLREQGECEIGTHLHPWNTPPQTEERTLQNTYTSNLPSALQYEKIKTLHDAISRNFGGAPTSYRSGRWGFNQEVASNLIRIGYAIDTSVYPAWDWSADGGIDFTEEAIDPFVYRAAPIAAGTGRALLEIPATVGFLQRSPLVAAAFRTIKRQLPGADSVLAALGKAGLVNHVCLSPEMSRTSHMIQLAQSLSARGARVLNLFFHSPSLLPKCAPFVRTEGELDDFLARIDGFLAFAQSAGIRPVTLSELSAERVGATTERLLPPSPNSLHTAREDSPVAVARIRPASSKVCH